MRPVGFSTGALARGDFRLALRYLKGTGTHAIELSALRLGELAPLAAALDSLDLSQFEYVSVHAPSGFAPRDEETVVRHLRFCLENGWPVVVHPDSITSFALWREFGDLLLVENMDKRKPIGRSAVEMERVLASLPQAGVCFDVAHARQFDSSMTEAYVILRDHGPLIKQVHVSEVDTRSRHVRISPSAIRDYREVAHLIPPGIPLIVESCVAPDEIPAEICRALDALTPSAISASS
jgi:sugar phosphate isomerase/epimerase